MTYPEDRLKGKIIGIDFDSTISHCPKWKGVGVFGKPIQNAKWAIEKFKEMGALIMIHTTRKETQLIRTWLKENEIPYDFVNHSPRNAKWKLSEKKLFADFYIDDRNISFNGDWRETFMQAMNFERWEKKESETAIRS